ncbi:hypothetical protein CCACVL1_22379, partial [Corchorus capsularis]
LSIASFCKPTLLTSKALYIPDMNPYPIQNLSSPQLM